MKPRKRKPNPAADRKAANRRQADSRARKRAMGLKPMEVWAYPIDHDIIKEYVRRTVASTEQMKQLGVAFPSYLAS